MKQGIHFRPAGTLTLLTQDGPLFPDPARPWIPILAWASWGPRPGLPTPSPCREGFLSHGFPVQPDPHGARHKKGLSLQHEGVSHPVPTTLSPTPSRAFSFKDLPCV